MHQRPDATGTGRPRDEAPDAVVPPAAEVSGRDFGDVALAVMRQRLPHLDQQALALDIALSRAANAHVQRSEASVHRRYGWSWSGFRIMFMLWLFEQAEARDLARLAGVSRQATSTVLATLEGKGIVERERQSRTDRRLVTVRLTEHGRRLLEEAFAEQNRLEAEWFGCLAPDEQRRLHDMLERVTDRIVGRAPTRGAARGDAPQPQ